MRKLLFLLIILFPFAVLATPVQVVKTKSGINAWLVEEHSQPLIAVSAAFRDSGTAYDPEGKDGRTNLVKNLLSEGAGDMDSGAFTVALEKDAIRLGFSADDDYLYASLHSLSEKKENAFRYLGLALSAPRFDDEAFARVKRQTLIAIKQQKEKPEYQLSRAWQKRVFANHPYGKEELGTVETVQNLQIEDLRDFTRKYITRENIVVSVVGDISASELEILLDKNFINLPEKYEPDVKVTDAALPDDSGQILLEKEIPQTMVRFGVQGIMRSDPDYIPAYVMNYILGGGALTSRLGVEIREKRGLAYSVFSSLTPMRHAALLQGSFATRNEKLADALQTLRQVLKEYAEKGVSEAELADAQKFLTGSFMVGLSSNESVVNFITMMQLQNLGADYMEKRNELINAVTKKQINDLAKRLLQLDKLQVVMVGKPENMNNQKTQQGSKN